MKRRKMILYILMLLPLVVTAAALPFLPDEIPAHYGADNQVTRWGSKYETLVFPAITIIFGLVMLGIGKYAAKQEREGDNNEKLSLLAGIMGLVIFNAMTLYFLYADIKEIENLSSLRVDINRLVFGLLGILFVVFGNVMPKAKLNSALGLRTVWSMKNETVWKKSQKFGGMTFIISGAAVIALCLFFEGKSLMLLSAAAFLIPLPLDIYYTYKISKKY